MRPAAFCQHRNKAAIIAISWTQNEWVDKREGGGEEGAEREKEGKLEEPFRANSKSKHTNTNQKTTP